MIFKAPLIPGHLVRRYKRFLADVQLADGSTVTAHVPNSGAMLGLTTPGLEVRLSPAANPGRKLPYTLEMVHTDNTWVGSNTSHPNALAQEAVASNRFSPFSGYTSVRREVKYGKNSRIDLLLEDPALPPLYVEVKNVHVRRPERHDGQTAEFPDSVTSRGAKHLEEMADMVRAGARALMLYIVQRGDCSSFRVAEDLDPAYAAAFAKARKAGVEALCLDCTVSPEGIDIGKPLPILG
ncbi:MAG: DNA/RNA nuclease SfsA [Pseudomonadota bacterium]|nr:DNA/RNA nuclease SfsA [Pseudomonadota bacterium]